MLTETWGSRGYLNEENDEDGLEEKNEDIRQCVRSTSEVLSVSFTVQDLLSLLLYCIIWHSHAHKQSIEWLMRFLTWILSVTSIDSVQYVFFSLSTMNLNPQITLPMPM